MSAAFGVQITEQLLRQFARYRGREITQEDLAREAIRLIHADGKNIDALQHALKLKADYGNGVSTHCLIYNATGTTLELVQSRNWSGSNFKLEPPRRFENGQWIAFLHIKPPTIPEGSIGARVFRGTDINGHIRDFLVAWNTPWGGAQNSVLTEVRGMNHFPNHWDFLYNLLRNSEKVSTDRTDINFSSSITIGGLTSPEYIAVLEHKFQPLPEEL